MFHILMCMELFFSGNTDFVCPTCGKVFETEEEFENRHNKKENKIDLSSK